MSFFRIVLVILIAIFGVMTGMEIGKSSQLQAEPPPVEQAEPTPTILFAGRNATVFRLCDRGNAVYVAHNPGTGIDVEIQKDDRVCNAQ